MAQADPAASPAAQAADPDLTERVSELERERELLNAIANYAPSLICLVDADGRVRPAATNKAFERTLGYEPGETGGVLFWERYVPAEDADDVRDAVLDAIAGGQVLERDGRWLTSSGEIIHVLWSCTPPPMIASGPIWLISATDITERKRHEDEVRTSRARIVAAGDEVRKRLGRNLHDGAQQRLVVLLLSLRAARTDAEGHPVLSNVLDSAIHEVAAALADLRELARGLHPAMLTDRGLGGALGPLVRRTPLLVELDVDSTRYPEAAEAAVYYVVAEALTNVAGYAEASKATVNVRPEGDRLIVEVEDDGVGGAASKHGTGLRGLEDRVAALDGTFSVHSPAGGGTRVRAEIPLA